MNETRTIVDSVDGIINHVGNTFANSGKVSVRDPDHIFSDCNNCVVRNLNHNVLSGTNVPIDTAESVTNRVGSCTPVDVSDHGSVLPPHNRSGVTVTTNVDDNGVAVGVGNTASPRTMTQRIRHMLTNRRHGRVTHRHDHLSSVS